MKILFIVSIQPKTKL